MAPGAFLDRGSEPGDRELQNVLGPARALWAQLRADLGSQFPPLGDKWSYAGKTHGWSLQLKQKKRTVLYLIPGRGSFVAALALGEKAFRAAQASRLPGPVLEVVDSAPRYPEGRAVRLEVRSKKDLASVEALAAIKMAS